MTDTPFPGTTLLPVLRPHVWDAGKGTLRVPLIRTKEELENNPWVSFAYSTDDKLYTVTKESLKAHKQKGSDLVLEALNNLQALEFEWEIAARRADGTAMVLTCTHEYACESVLLPEHLTEAQSMLGCHEVALAIPVAGHLIAQSAHPTDRAELDHLMDWSHRNYLQSEGRSITPNLVTAGMGNITSMLCNPLTDQRLTAQELALKPLLYETEEQVLAFSVEKEPVPLWELERLSTILHEQKMADGRPIQRLEVVAKDEVQAQRISRVLDRLDVIVCIASGDRRVPFAN